MSFKYKIENSDIDMTAGIFLVSSGAEIRPLFQWDLGDFFPNLKKKIYIFLEFSQSPNTHKLHGDNLYYCILLFILFFLQFKGNSMCNS